MAVADTDKDIDDTEGLQDLVQDDDAQEDSGTEAAQVEDDGQTEGDEDQAADTETDDDEPEKPRKPAKPSRAERRIKELLAHNKALESRLARIEQSTAEKDSKAKFDILTSRYEQAVQAGNKDAVTEARQALAEYKPDAPPPPADTGPQFTDAAADWVDRNPWIRTDPKRAQVATAIETMLVAEGYSVDDPSLYEALDREMAKRGQASQRRRPSGVGDPGSPGSDGRGKPRLTQEDLQTMTLLGEDPNDPATRKAWLAQKQQQAR